MERNIGKRDLKTYIIKKFGLHEKCESVVNTQAATSAGPSGRRMKKLFFVGSIRLMRWKT
jgi:hypothetical protein